MPYAATVGLTHALEMARAGFTTVRDLGGDTSAVIAVRDAVAEGRFPGPRIKVSGAPLSIIGGHADPATGLPPELADAVNEAHLNPSVCTGVEECQKVVRQLAAAGVDVIKVMATGGVLDPGAMGLEQHFTDAELKGIADMAHAMHLKVAAHAHGARGILGRDQRRHRFDRARHLPRRGRRRRDEGARHLLFGDADGVQRSPARSWAPAS